MAQAVKCTRSAAGAPGFASSGPRHAPTHCLAGHAVAVSHIKWRKMGMDVSSGPVFLSKKRKTGTDVSIGLTFLTKKKKSALFLIFKYIEQSISKTLQMC